MFEHVQKWTPVSSKWFDFNEQIQTFEPPQIHGNINIISCTYSVYGQTLVYRVSLLEFEVVQKFEDVHQVEVFRKLLG